MTVDSNKIHIVCTSQAHTCAKYSEKQIQSVSNALSASANYLRKLVEGNKEPSNQNGDKKDSKESHEISTVSVHADSSYKDALIGFTEYDSREVDSDAYSVKRQKYDKVRQKYPNVDILTRDVKVQALKELDAVGFRYYSITVTAFVMKDGLTRTVRSKSHHRLERPSRDYLQDILRDTFKGTIRTEEKENASGSKEIDAAGDGSPDDQKGTSYDENHSEAEM